VTNDADRSRPAGEEAVPAFAAATALQPRGEGEFAWEVTDGWQQGPGAWGGLVAGGVTAAVTAVEPEPARTLRTVSIHMVAPLVTGPARVRVEPVRLGSGMSTWAVAVDGADGTRCTSAVVITGRDRAGDLAADAGAWGTAAAPTLPAWRDVPVAPPQGPGWPTFVQHLEFRVVEGWPGSGTARCAGYLRFLDQGPWDARQLLSLVDAWYPTALPVLSGLRPMATVTYAAHLLLDPRTVPAGEPLAYEATMSAAHGGYTTELRRLWTLDGRLAVENHQAIVLVR
jgi:hypothetical protein